MRRFSFNHGSRINARTYGCNRIDLTVAPDTVEVWVLANDSYNQQVSMYTACSSSTSRDEHRPRRSPA